MYAFIDETGNTGANLFDPDQPLFLTAAVITKTDFDLAYRSQYNKICRKIGVNSIHASDLGFGPLETISVDLVRLLKSADARFFISKVEKKYLLATKVFDTF